MTEKYKVTGMSCAACSARVERAVSSLDGVESCAVNLLTGDMTVVGKVSRSDVTSAVTDAGYGIKDDTPTFDADGKKEDDAATRVLIIRLFVSLGLVAVIMYLSMGHMIGLTDPFTAHPLVNGILQMVISLTVMIINCRFFINGIKGAIHLAPNMDTLVSLGSLASFGYSLAMLIAMISDISAGGSGKEYLHEFYFESAAMILALITLGKMLESRAKGRTTSALRGLVALKGKYATLRLPSGEMRLIPIACKATIGQVGNLDHELVSLGKAGRKRHMGIKPTVRGVVMNPCDHPHGGGEGKSPIGRPSPVTPWGVPTLGHKTRSKHKNSNKYIVKRIN